MSLLNARGGQTAFAEMTGFVLSLLCRPALRPSEPPPQEMADKKVLTATNGFQIARGHHANPIAQLS